MVGTRIRVMLVLCLVASLAACTQESPDRPDRGNATPTTPPQPSVTQDTGASVSPENTVVENTVGGVVLRHDESVLRIDRAELIRSEKGGDEVFVHATIRRPGTKNCQLLQDEAWFALRRSIETGDPAVASRAKVSTWVDPLSSQRFSSSNTLAVSFREDTTRKEGAPGPRNTPFFAVCFETTGPPHATYYDMVHVEGTPKVP